MHTQGIDSNGNPGPYYVQAAQLALYRLSTLASLQYEHPVMQAASSDLLKTQLWYTSRGRPQQCGFRRNFDWPPDYAVEFAA